MQVCLPSEEPEEDQKDSEEEEEKEEEEEEEEEEVEGDGEDKEKEEQSPLLQELRDTQERLRTKEQEVTITLVSTGGIYWEVSTKDLDLISIHTACILNPRPGDTKSKQNTAGSLASSSLRVYGLLGLIGFESVEGISL